MKRLAVIAVIAMTQGCITIDRSQEPAPIAPQVTCPTPVINVRPVYTQPAVSAPKTKAKVKKPSATYKPTPMPQDDPKKCLEWKLETREEKVCARWVD